MSVILINPNSTEAMTDMMVSAASKAAPDLEFAGWTSNDGPPAIQGVADGALAEGPFLKLIAKANDEQADGIIIGCFDDTALAEAARLAHCPVIGIGQAAYFYAALRHWRFSVVTTLAVSVPILEANIARYGLSGYLGRVRASEVPVLDLDREPLLAGDKVAGEAAAAQTEDDVDAIILGCGGMAQVLDKVVQSVEIPVLDPVICAARCFRWLV